MIETQTLVLGLKSGRAVLMDVVMVETTPLGVEVFRRDPNSLKTVVEQSGYDCVSWVAIDKSQIPDRTFQSAWRLVDGTIAIDMIEARAILRDRIRAARKPLMGQLDIAYQRADEVGNEALKLDIAARKAALRDCTHDPMIEAAATPEQLKQVWPEAMTLALTPFSIEQGERSQKPERVEVDLTPILAAIAALDEKLQLTDKKADEASKQASKSLKYIDAINEGMGNVAEGRV